MLFRRHCIATSTIVPNALQLATLEFPCIPQLGGKRTRDLNERMTKSVTASEILLFMTFLLARVATM